MKSRITQLILRHIMVAASIGATYLGLDADPAVLAEIVTPIIAGLIGVVAYAMDLGIHRAETGSVVAPAGQSKK